MKQKRNIIMICLFLGLSLVLELAARMIDGFAQWYSTHLYVLWVQLLGRFSGILPFSLVEMLLYLTIIIVVVAVIVRLVQGKEIFDIPFLIQMVTVASGLVFLFVINCGVNYYRDSFEEVSGITVREYSVEDLEEVCIYLTDEVNTLAEQVPRAAEGTMIVEEQEAKEIAREALKNLGDTYPDLKGYYPEPKAVTVSEILSIQSISGVYSPFTIEANYNQDMADYNIPFTMCHELSHLRGFMNEKEANFIAYLACIQSEDEAFQYSGNLLGWIYCMNELHRVDPEKWATIRQTLDQKVEVDLKENSKFWESYDGKIAQIQDKVNDTYLKANGQKAGIKSYDLLVDLVVAYYFGPDGDGFNLAQ